MIFLLAAASRAALFALDSSFLAVVAFAAGNALLLSAVCGIRYRRGPSLVRNMCAVLKKASYGTRRIFGSPPVLKIGFSGTEGIFGAGNALLRYETELVCAKHRVFPLTPVFSIDTM